MVVEVATSGEYKLTNLGDHTSRVQNLLDHPNWTSYREQLFDWWLEGWIERLDGWSLAGGVDEWVVEVILQLTKNTCSIQWLLDFHTWFQWLVHLVSGLEISTRWHGANAFWCHLVEMSEKKYMFCVSRINNLIHVYIYMNMLCQIKCTQYDKLYINTQIDCGKHSVYVDNYTC